MRTDAAVAAAILLAVGAHLAGDEANRERRRWPATYDLPWAPSPGAAPYVSLGYREFAADLFWIRVLGYVGGDEDQAAGTRGLTEAIVALDPHFERVYAWSGLAITSTGTNATRDDMLAAIRVLEQGMKIFPDDYKIPLEAGQIYTVELESKDPAEEARWKLEGARLLERAVRIPNAPKDVATFAAHLRTQLGQREKAIRDLQELILYTSDAKQRDKLVQKLAELEGTDSAAIDYELEVEKARFEARWRSERPELPATSYLLIGPRLAPAFHLEDSAVDRDLIGTEQPIEPLPPLTD